MGVTYWEDLGMKYCGRCGLWCGCTESHDACKGCGGPFDASITVDVGGES